MKKLLLTFILLTGVVSAATAQDTIQNKTPKVKYDGYCGWAAYKNYKYPAKKHIYVVEEGDTIRFYNERTKKKWLAVPYAIRKANKNWKELTKEE